MEPTRDHTAKHVQDIVLATLTPSDRRRVASRMSSLPREANSRLWLVTETWTGIEWLVCLNGTLSWVDLKQKSVVNKEPNYHGTSWALNGVEPMKVSVYGFVPTAHDPVPPMLLQGPGHNCTYRDPHGNYTALPPDTVRDILKMNGVETWEDA